MSIPRLVLFDIDGTLLYSAGCGRAASRLALPDVFGTAGELDETAFAGKTDWGILLEALAPAGITADEVRANMGRYNDALARHMRVIVADYAVRPCPGAPDVVAALAQDPAVLIGLVTGNVSQIVPIKLSAAGYDPAVFRVGAFGSEGWERPMLPPLAVARAAALTGIDYAPEHTVILGDTPGDIACAASIGARTIAVATGPFTVEQLQPFAPDYLFDSMADPAAVLHAIYADSAG